MLVRVERRGLDSGGKRACRAQQADLGQPVVADQQAQPVSQCSAPPGSRVWLGRRAQRGLQGQLVKLGPQGCEGRRG